jgi:dienelactone hydrolase
MQKRLCLIVLSGFCLSGLVACSPGLIFPVWDPNFFDEPPAELGPYEVEAAVVDVPEGADGSPAKITVFRPIDAEGPRPLFMWVLGSNVQPYYHQSLHETLASWGYAVIVPDARPLTFTDFQYNRRNVDLAKQAVQLALDGEIGVEVDPERLAAGGYSIGGTQALFVGAEDARIDAVVLWAPSSSPFWTGVDPEALYPQVTQSVYFLLAELDNVVPVDGFPREVQGKLVNADITEYIIPEGLHLYFQQPTGADSASDPASSLTRFEQQGIAIERTRIWLDEQLGSGE